MFFKILAKRFTVSLGKPGICSMAKKSYDIRVQVFHHTPWPPFSTHRPHRQRKEKWCRLLTWQCWNKKHQWTDRHIAKKVWHLIFIYIFIYIYIYYNRIIYSYIYIYIYIIIWISIISAGSLSKTLDVTILGSMRQQRNFLVLPIAFTCEAMNALAYVYMFVIHVSTVAFRFGPNCLSMHIWYALWVCF